MRSASTSSRASRNSFLLYSSACRSSAFASNRILPSYDMLLQQRFDLRSGFVELAADVRLDGVQPLLAVENIDQYFPIPSEYMPNKQSFMLKVKGESMINARIEPGDLVVVEKQEKAEDGDIVVALGDETGSSLKRLVKNGRKCILHPENETMEDIVVKDLKIQGVARFVIKKL